MIRYVCGFVISPNNSLVALILKERPKWQKGFWNGIGGKVEPTDQSDAHAMTREFYQEAGVWFSPCCWTEIVTLRGDDWECVFFYYKTISVLKVKTMEKERVQICDVDNLPNNVIYNIRWLIPLAIDDNVAKPLGMAGITLTDAGIGGKLVPLPE